MASFQTSKFPKSKLLQIQKYQKRFFNFQKVQVSDNLESEWIEVIAFEKLDEILIQQIQLALKGRNTYKDNINGTWTPKTQDALEHFQIKNDLYVGQLDKGTLEKLGFSFSLLRFSNSSDTNLQLFELLNYSFVFYSKSDQYYIYKKMEYQLSS